MSMTIKTNMDAVRSFNMMDANRTRAYKHLEKVSTGMKVRNAQDDASAYAISEKMRVRIRALEQAHSNTQNGSNMIKTAEGAVSCILDSLRTLKEKAIDAANDSNSDEDRRMIQKEFDQLIDQIDEDALIQFNGMHLIDDTRNNALYKTYDLLSNHKLAKDTDLTTKFSDMKTRSGESLGIKDTDTISWSYVSDGETFHGEVKGSDNFNELANDMLNRASLSPMLIAKTGDGNISYGLPNKFGREIFGTAGPAVSSKAEEVHDQIAGFTLQVKDSDGTVNKFANAQLQFKEMNRNETATGDRALSFHVGADANVATKFALTDMRAKALGLKGDDDNIISISTKEDANAAINVLDLAIEKVLDQQTTIGAALTRLDRTATNLTTTVTDDQSSESVIRDADMAKEMAGYAKYNLLSQTSQAMLAQANQNPLDVLYLLGLGEE